jgi:hypothetical protein
LKAGFKSLCFCVSVVDFVPPMTRDQGDYAR